MIFYLFNLKFCDIFFYYLIVGSWWRVFYLGWCSLVWGPWHVLCQAELLVSEEGTAAFHQKPLFFSKLSEDSSKKLLDSNFGFRVWEDTNKMLVKICFRVLDEEEDKGDSTDAMDV